MRVKLHNGNVLDVINAVDHECTPSPYSYSGALERAEERANKAVLMLGELIQALADRAILTPEEVGNLCGGEVVE